MNALFVAIKTSKPSRSAPLRLQTMYLSVPLTFNASKILVQAGRLNIIKLVVVRHYNQKILLLPLN